MMMEPSDATFRMFHRYNRLVRRQLVQPLTHSCGAVYVTGLDKNDELVLRCLQCNTEISPGMDTLERVYAVVTEHFVNDEEE